jgi:DNA-binding LacI/PurR family transcriptional regulator
VHGRLASLPHIDLTTIGQDPAALVDAAVHQLAARLDVAETTRLSTVLPATLITRGSTGVSRERP